MNDFVHWISDMGLEEDGARQEIGARKFGRIGAFSSFLD